jgi:hypothetical protein
LCYLICKKVYSLNWLSDTILTNLTIFSDFCNCNSTHELYFTSLALSSFVHPHLCLHTYQMPCSIRHVSFFVLSLFCPSHSSRTQYYWNQMIIQIKVLIWSLQMIALVVLIILTPFFKQINNSTIHDYCFISFYRTVTITIGIRYYVLFSV